MRSAKCSDAVLCMTSIKRFRSPEAQNNTARKKKLLHRRESLQPRFAINANYKREMQRGAQTTLLFFQICSVIILRDNSHVLLWPFMGGSAALAGLLSAKPSQSERLWAVFTSPDLRHTCLFGEGTNVWECCRRDWHSVQIACPFCNILGIALTIKLSSWRKKKQTNPYSNLHNTGTAKL